MRSITLNTGVQMPTVGFGTYNAGSHQEAVAAVRAALDAGYRHIDTARIYRNEEAVGQAIRESGLPREELFVTTKLWNDDHGFDEALRACHASLERLGLSYLDLYLIHWPVPDARQDSWRALERLHEEGTARAIGVSNYAPHHLEELLAHANTIPAVHQYELHPFLQQREMTEASLAHGIAVQAYSPFTRGRHLEDERLMALAKGLGCTPAQALLRWSVERGFSPLPKSSNPERIRQNFDLFGFEMPEETLVEMDAWDEGRRTAWDPTQVA